MRGKNIVVVGGSIAGCATAVLLQRLGANVTILEQSSGRIGQGSGITLPESVVNQCIENDLFDAS
ncbi:NAD(P)-binding protein [Legionella rowbothamii]|uniref:NAD(P)-binding protein n=1 Tax=Legionella rowbothamii TaxID=96229 RepID=UPI001054A2A5|nr:NAD(P)-binding protein [Legionella rowbothamii]